MKLFEDCTAEEMPVFRRIAEGGDVNAEDPTIVQQLVEKGLLSSFDGDDTHLTVPAMVWNLWEHFIETE
jgi:hypothetical protein